MAFKWPTGAADIDQINKSGEVQPIALSYLSVADSCLVSRTMLLATLDLPKPDGGGQDDLCQTGADH